MASFADRLPAVIPVLLLCGMSPAAPAATVGFSAVIGTDTTGCSVSVPDSTLSFALLQARDLTEPVTTYQIKPLQVVLSCTGDVGGEVTPSLSLTGTTPYAGTGNTVFLDGEMNGAGFMVRQSDGSMPSLSDYYSTADAVANNGTPRVMTALDSSNGYYREEAFWVGLVGPLGESVVPGRFSATLIVNVVFQ